MSDQKFYSTGRGGAGNIGHGSTPSEPTYAEEGTSVPKIKQEVFTTGRGGAGNMRSNTDAEVARKLQDVDGPAGPVEPENPTLSSAAVGRGGYGNVMATREAANAEKQSFVERVKGLFGKSEESPSSNSNQAGPSSSN